MHVEEDGFKKVLIHYIEFAKRLEKLGVKNIIVTIFRRMEL